MLSPRENTLACAILCLALIGTCARALQSFSPFSDASTLNPHYGESSQYVEHLGRMVRLRTWVTKHTSFPCTFTIQTRRIATEVEFNPDWYCFRGACNNYKYDLDKLAASGFNPELRTIILVGGYLSDSTSEWIDHAAALWLDIEEVNVIKVSWVNGNRYIYEEAVSGTPIVAREITILLHHLAGMHGIELTQPEFAERIQIVGHSLGAHIGAFVGQDLGGLVGRITGLDPAGVFYDLQPRDLRLDPTDALFVDVIHTNGGKFHTLDAVISAPAAALDWTLSKMPILGALASRAKRTFGEGYNREGNTSWFGIDQQVGHIDYYANDGRIQPDCESSLHICDHSRACDIYLDFLAYEFHMLRNFGRNQLRQNRLLTFRSEEFDSFFIGDTMAANCEAILSNGQQRQGLWRSMKRCSLPMDLTSRVDELINEFSDDYGIETFAKPAELVEAKYFFSTRGKRPLVGNHYLLKITTLGGLGRWESKCVLKTEIQLPDGSTTLIKTPRDADSAIEQKPRGITLPIRVASDERSGITAVFAAPTTRPIQDSAEFGNEFLPRFIDLSVSTTGASNSVVRAVASKVWSYVKSKLGANPCILLIDSVEIVPLIGSEKTPIGLYKSINRRNVVDTTAKLTFSLDSVITQ